MLKTVSSDSPGSQHTREEINQKLRCSQDLPAAIGWRVYIDQEVVQVSDQSSTNLSEREASQEDSEADQYPREIHRLESESQEEAHLHVGILTSPRTRQYNSGLRSFKRSIPVVDYRQNEASSKDMQRHEEARDQQEGRTKEDEREVIGSDATEGSILNLATILNPSLQSRKTNVNKERMEIMYKNKNFVKQPAQDSTVSEQ